MFVPFENIFAKLSFFTFSIFLSEIELYFFGSNKCWRYRLEIKTASQNITEKTSNTNEVPFSPERLAINARRKT